MRHVKRLQYKRKREGRTNYRKRLRFLLSRTPRAVVRRSLNNFTVQIIKYETKGDKIVAASSSKALVKYGWKGHKGNMPAAYLTGLIAGKKAIAGKTKEAILDIGLQTPARQSVLYAALKGLLDAGMKIAHSTEVLPTEDAIQGKKIEEYAKKLKQDEAKYKKQFSSYIKNNIKPEELTKHFSEVKQKIMSEK
jgi:large subunit ribosomal protein L18